MLSRSGAGRDPTEVPFDFLLERLVHQMLRDDTRCGHELLDAALCAGADPQWLLAEILWPAAECLVQLRRDALITRRVFNHAGRTLAQLAGDLDARLPGVPARGRRLLIVSAGAEPDDLGAHLLAILAEAAGFTALFAGAGLNSADLAFAVTNLQPDAVVIHGCLEESWQATKEWVTQLQKARRGRGVQIAVVGAMMGVRSGGKSARALGDLSSHHPLEILELLALCPDHRAVPREETQALRMAAGITEAVHARSIDVLMREMFGRRLHFN